MADRELDDDEKGHSVVDGVLLKTSVSAVTTFAEDQYAGCNRRWYFNKVLHIPEPQTAAKDRGVKLHKQIEHYGKTGEDVLSPILRPGKHLIPRHAPGMVWEGKFGLRDRGLVAAGVPFIGYIDLYNESGWWLDDDGGSRPMGGDEVETADWKTTSSIDDYGKSGIALVDTIQMPGYAEYARRKNPKLRQFRLSHVYFQTQSPYHAKKVTTLMSLPVLEKRWKKIEETVASMVEVATFKDVKDVRPNYDSCNAYRGCPYRGEHCPRPVSAVVAGLFKTSASAASITGGKTMGLLDKARRTSGAANDSTPAGGTPPPVNAAPHSQPSAEEVAKARAALLMQEQGVPAADPTPPPPPPPVRAAEPEPEPYAYVPAKSIRHKAYIFLHNPDGKTGVYARANVPTPEGYAFIVEDGTVRQIPLEQAVCYVRPADLPPAKVALFAAHDAPKVPPAPPPSAPPPPPRASVPVAPPDAPLSQPGKSAAPIPPDALAGLPPEVRAVVRPEEIVGGAAASVATDPAAGAGATPPPAAGTEAPKRGPGRPRKVRTGAPPPANVPGAASTSNPEGVSDVFRLYVDTIPSFPYLRLESYIDSVCGEIAKTLGVVDIRAAGKDSLLAFGGWKGVLAARVREEPPEAGVYVVFARQSEIAQIVVEALSPIADEVARGVY